MYTAKILLGIIVGIAIIWLAYDSVVLVLYNITYDSNPNPQSYLGLPIFLVLPPCFINQAFLKISGIELHQLIAHLLNRLTGRASGEALLYGFVLFIWPAAFYLICRHKVSWINQHKDTNPRCKLFHEIAG